ncbi:MAG: hypothetical protein ACREF5_02865 [Candidatus Saccharimonadales bacterium]
MRLSGLSLLVALAVIIGLAIGWIPASYSSRTVVDISWPNCKITPVDNSTFGIVGVNGGLDFRPNPCLALESSWFSHLSLYLNTGYPGKSFGEKFKSYPNKCNLKNTICLAYNYGYNATIYSLKYAAKEGAHTTHWWLDVETDNSWTNNPIINRASLEGAIFALRQNSFLPLKIGFYSTKTQWDIITGNWRNYLPSWVGTGSSSSKAAVRACKQPSFNGGSILFSQYTKGLDKNYVCVLK